MIVAPDYYDWDEADFQIALVEITYQAKFNQLTHGQILGTLINELGIKRSLLGDIFVETGYAQLMINRQLLGYVLTTISKIARASVSLKEIPLNQLIKSSNDAQLVDIMVSSLRLDRLVATVLKNLEHKP